MGSISFKLMSPKDCALRGKRLPNIENILPLKMGMFLLWDQAERHGMNMAMKVILD